MRLFVYSKYDAVAMRIGQVHFHRIILLLNIFDRELADEDFSQYNNGICQ